MTAIASKLSKTLPARPLSIADIYALNSEGHLDVSPILGLQPDPRETVILLQVTTESTIQYLGVEREAGWELLATISLDGSTAIETAIGTRLDTVLEWADTYYDTEQYALLQKIRIRISLEMRSLTPRFRDVSSYFLVMGAYSVRGGRC